MSWLDRQHKRIALEKKIDKAMQSHKYQEAQKERDREACSNAMDSILLMSADYLWLNFHCHRNGIIKYLEHIIRQFPFVEADPDYYRLLNIEIEREAGINIKEFMTGKISLRAIDNLEKCAALNISAERLQEILEAEAKGLLVIKKEEDHGVQM